MSQQGMSQLATPELAITGQAKQLLDDYLSVCTFPDSDTLLCAVSGGADSAALLCLAHQHAQSTGAAVSAVHVDHGLRPHSAEDAVRVKSLADRLDVALIIKQVEIKPGSNLEERARLARHGALGPNALLGHTADDRAETVLLQLLRGGALDAIGSMRQTATRPLLALRRRDTEAICEAVGYDPVVDSTNHDPRFVRNRVRHEVLPLLNEVFQRDVTPLLARAAALASDEADLLDDLAAAIDPTDARMLTAAPLPLARRAIRTWLRSPHPPDAASVQRVLLVAQGHCRATEINDGRRVSRHAGRLVLTNKSQADKSQASASRLSARE